MTTLFWTPDEVELKTFSSSSKKTAKGLETLIKIELSVKDTFAIASLLRQLDDASRKQEDAKKPHPKPPTKKSERLALPAPLLRIADHREGSK
ncbi:hypothetical protein [Rhizobium mayense]|uniref:Uncharacterized protein n=1 Tax=Rhizobium mayense TaxID=1312184 RepID=A0ABT7JYC1_9HYPH|nr:hypothetical protein [Rhizobium mayense]MDL2401276.1 hypothetical protein [Rhizobium mayense]